MASHSIVPEPCGLLTPEGRALKLPEKTPPEERTVTRRQTFLLMFAAFSAYFSMYAFRKPISATEFSGVAFLGSSVDLKTAFLIGQVVGYAVSKFLGIIVCSSLSREARARTLVGLIVFAELALVAFALASGVWQVVAMFVNGLPLGMVWGLVVRYLEGRRTSEPLLAGLSFSFIVSSGALKDAGVWLIHARGVSERGCRRRWVPCS